VINGNFVGANAPNFNVSVTNGTGGGNFAADTAVTITAGTPPSGQIFNGWTITPAVTFTSGSLLTPTATFTMPAQVVTATANFTATTVTFNPTSTTINDGNLSQSVTVQGTATGNIAVSYIVPTALQPYVNVTWTAAAPSVTITGTRPTTDVTPRTGNFNIYVTRGGVTEYFSVDVNLTTTWGATETFTPPANDGGTAITDFTPAHAPHDVPHDVPQTGTTGRMILPIILSLAGLMIITGSQIFRIISKKGKAGKGEV
jgi:hypothetical protein